MPRTGDVSLTDLFMNRKQRYLGQNCERMKFQEIKSRVVRSVRQCMNAREFSPSVGVLSLCLFAFLSTIFAASPIRLPTDSRWSVHTALSFARGHGGDLTEFLPIIEREKFYAIESPDGRVRSRYPIGTSLLVAPAVGLIAVARPAWAEDLRTKIPARTEQMLASLIGAMTCVVFFWVVFQSFRSVPVALFSALMLGLSTAVWSTATRALWQHGPLILMLSIAMLLLLEGRKRPAVVQFVSLPLIAGYVIRPTGIVPLGILSLYVLLYYRAFVPKYVAWSLLIVVPWTLYNFSIYGMPLSPYYFGEAFTSQTHFLEGLLGNLFSPSRGLFVFSPVLLFAVSGFVIALRSGEERPLVIALASIVVGQLIIVGSASMWWAGHSFGPRFTTDILPIVVYFTAFNFRLPESLPRRLQYPVSSLIVVLAAVSALIHAQGAIRYGTWQWNYMPDSIDDHPSRAWDWTDAQFVRKFRN